ncbi:MAG: hypothetical protein JO032_13935, partial [Alphaproteobacteria bacterium]|nr:hypothetical protein [Alphaproteobacteria bacterium]
MDVDESPAATDPLPAPTAEDGGAALATAGRGAGRPRAALHPRLEAMLQAARYYGVELDPGEFRGAPGFAARAVATAGDTAGGEAAGRDPAAPSAAELSLWAQEAGMWSRAVRIRWRHLLRLRDTGPVVLLLADGGAGLLTGVDAEQNVVFLKNVRAGIGAPSVAIDELRLAEAWAGDAVLLRARRGY